MPAPRPLPLPPAWTPASVLLTHRKDTIGEMSCNPAIGGIAKGNAGPGDDALDGIMGRAIDRAGIHYRMLNASKGPPSVAPAPRLTASSTDRPSQSPPRRI